MIDVHFVLLGALINILGSIGYARDTIKGITKPNRVTWFLWSLAPLIAFSAELKEGVGLRSLMTFMVGFGPLIIFIASFLDRKAYWKLSKFDISCGILSVLAIVLWQLSGQGDVAIVLSIAADFLAALPTIFKAYKQPASESSIAYLCGGCSAIITFLTIQHWTIAVCAFPLYILLINIPLFSFVKFPHAYGRSKTT